jgi:hypothetical protein
MRNPVTGQFQPRAKNPPERPGPNIEPTRQQHALVAMLILLSMLNEGKEAKDAFEALTVFAWRAWQWDVVRLREELAKCQEMLVYAGELRVRLERVNGLKIRLLVEHLVEQKSGQKVGENEA